MSVIHAHEHIHAQSTSEFQFVDASLRCPLSLLMYTLIAYQYIYQHFTVERPRVPVNSTAYRGHYPNGPGWVEHWSRLESGAREIFVSECRLSFLCKFLIGDIDSKSRLSEHIAASQRVTDTKRKVKKKDLSPSYQPNPVQKNLLGV